LYKCELFELILLIHWLISIIALSCCTIWYTRQRRADGMTKSNINMSFIPFMSRCWRYTAGTYVTKYFCSQTVSGLERRQYLSWMSKSRKLSRFCRKTTWPTIASSRETVSGCFSSRTVCFQWVGVECGPVENVIGFSASLTNPMSKYITNASIYSLSAFSCNSKVVSIEASDSTFRVSSCSSYKLKIKND